MGYYMSMQAVRFRSPDDYERFKMLFANVKDHLSKIDGFINLTWWVHPEDATWFNEISIWTELVKRFGTGVLRDVVCIYAATLTPTG